MFCLLKLLWLHVQPQKLSLNIIGFIVILVFFTQFSNSLHTKCSKSAMLQYFLTVFTEYDGRHVRHIRLKFHEKRVNTLGVMPNLKSVAIFFEPPCIYSGRHLKPNTERKYHHNFRKHY
jgi:hypothetical protein